LPRLGRQPDLAEPSADLKAAGLDMVGYDHFDVATQRLTFQPPARRAR